jgi:hypothetical protein
MIKLGEESKECARCMVIFELYLKVEKTENVFAERKKNLFYCRKREIKFSLQKFESTPLEKIIKCCK